MKSHKHHLYNRYHIEAKETPNIVQHPYRFNVKVKKLGLAKLLIKELIHYRGNLDVILSRPCVYGVFSGPLGGFSPRKHLCVGCLRCTTQYPEMVDILHNPKRQALGDDYFTPERVDSVVYEAETGRVPVKGAGYRGQFGGAGWDGMWTDMSEIVRPTRDGIHGREFISTEVDIGEKPGFLKFDEQQQIFGAISRTFTTPIPILFDTLPLANMLNPDCIQGVCKAARQLGTFSVVPFEVVKKFGLKGSAIIPLIKTEDIKLFQDFGFEPNLLELDGWDEQAYKNIKNIFPQTLIVLRTDFENENLEAACRAGIRIFHLTADYHGKGKSGRFVLDLIREAHLTFVKLNCRDEVTLIGSGGMIVAEHIPKAIICGLDAVAIDTSLLVALQARFNGTCINPSMSNFELPKNLTTDWACQRIKNLVSSWRDQLLEVLGAMGLREVRRLRGEMGRAMFHKDLENESFSGISGYEQR